MTAMYSWLCEMVSLGIIPVWMLVCVGLLLGGLVLVSAFKALGAWLNGYPVWPHAIPPISVCAFLLLFLWMMSSI